MKCTLIYEREQTEGPCAIWCKVQDPDGNIICGKYGTTRDEARDRAIIEAKSRLVARLNPIESEEVEL